MLEMKQRYNSEVDVRVQIVLLKASSDIYSSNSIVALSHSNLVWVKINPTTNNHATSMLLGSHRSEGGAGPCASGS